MLCCMGYIPMRAQLYTRLGQKHNQFFVGSGYSNSFINLDYGLNHSRYFKRLKRDVIGILDFSTPLSYNCYTRFVFRKGFQFNIFQKNNFCLPMAIISSTVKKHLSLFNLHDIVTGVYLLPGIYTDKYTIAADLSVNFLVYNKVHFNSEAPPPPNNQRPFIKPEKVNISLGIVVAYNLQRFSFIAKGGFQQISNWEYDRIPFYAIGILAYKLNFRKHVEQQAATAPVN